MAEQNGTAPQYREQVEYYEKQVDENENRVSRDQTCGVGSCRPKCMRPCSNIYVYSILLSLEIIFFMSYGAYYMGTVRTLERRFGFSSKEVGILSSFSDIIQTCVLIFIGYLGSRLSKPRMLSGLLVFSCLGMLLTSLPYFLYGPRRYDVTMGSANTTLNLTSTDRGSNYQVCSLDNSTSQCTKQDAKLTEENEMTYNIYLAAFLLIGLGTSGLSNIGISFIDENVKKEDTGIYIGIVGSMYAVGPMIGFGLASATTSLPEDLRDSHGLSSKDPDFIGCWWLGGIIFASLTFIILVSMFFFPKHLPDYYKYHKRTKKTAAAAAGDSTCMREVQLFFRAFARLACNPAYVLLVCSQVAAMYIAVGILVNFTRYMEVHFRLPTFVANIAAAICGALASAIGGILSGIVMKRRKLQAPALATIIVVVEVIVVISLIILMLLSCPQPQVQGRKTSTSAEIQVNTTCNADCGCNREKYEAVCAEDSDNLYFSPCHAGCVLNLGGNYTNCTCAAEGPDVVLTASNCPKSTCITVYPYLAIYAFALLVGAFSRPPATVLVFRVVDPELKSLALGIQSTLFNLLVFIPGPIIMGTLFDLSCLVWQKKCKDRGTCLLYDLDRYRFSLHGIVLGFMVVALLFAIALRIVLRNHRDPEDDDMSGEPVRLAVEDNGYVNEQDESTDM